MLASLLKLKWNLLSLCNKSSILLFIYAVAFEIQILDAHEETMIKNSIHKIAIIGGGIGGTSTAYFARELFKDDIIIDLYEPGTIGGRLATSKHFDNEYETGGSIIHSKNMYMQQFVEKLGLSKNGNCASHLGLFDGKNYAFTESDWEVVNIVKMLYRYGLDFYNLHSQNKDMLESFSRIYKLQRDGVSFKTVSSLLAAMDPEFPSLLNKSIEVFLKENGFHDQIIEELVSAVTRANYGQMPNIHAFVGQVSITGAGDDLWSVQGGNKRIAEELLKVSNVNHLQKTVTSIIYTKDRKFHLISSKGSEGFLHRDSKEKYKYSSSIGNEIYDAVVIATPMTTDKTVIRVLNGSVAFSGSYQRIVCTLVQGILNPIYLFPNDENTDIDEILTFNPNLFYNSIGRQRSVNVETKGDCEKRVSKVYKIFSPDHITETQMKMLFSSWSTVEEDDWLAYPHYILDEKIEPLELAPGLYYNNAIEKAASAMEMVAVSAKNSALLLHEHLSGGNPKVVDTDTKSEL